MEIKGFGDLSASPAPEGELHELIREAVDKVRTGQSASEDRPLPTGSLSVDYATGAGGLPRGCVVALRGSARPAEALLWSTISKTQERGGLAVILDLAARFTEQRAREFGIDLRRLVVVRPEAAGTALELANRLVDRTGIDLLVIDSVETLEEPPRWRPVARRHAARWLRGALEELAASLRGSLTCLMVTHGTTRGGSSLVERVIGEESELQLQVASEVAGPNAGALVAEVEVTPPLHREPRRVTLDVDPGGRISRLADLVDPGMSEELIRQRGPDLAYGQVKLGRTRQDVARNLRENLDVALDLERLVEHAVASQRAAARATLAFDAQREAGAAAGEPPSEGSRGDQERESEGRFDVQGPIGEQPGLITPLPTPRFVNAWFEGDREPILPLRVGQAYVLRLNIGSRRYDPPASAQGVPFVEPDFGFHEDLALLIGLYSEDFLIARAQHPLVLPRIGDSSEIETVVTPKGAGTCSLFIIVSLVRELEVLQELEVEVPVEERVSVAPSLEGV